MKVAIWGNELNAWAMAAMLAEYGNQVIMTEQTERFAISSEPKLQELIERYVQSKSITLCHTEESPVADIHLFSFRANQKDQALALAKRLGKQSPSAFILLNQSNFGIGATQQLKVELAKSAPEHQVAYIPDNVPEGRAIDYLRNMPSLILGSDGATSSDTIRALMRPFMLDPQKVLVMSPQEAEFAKFAVTGMLALRIGYINELANLADQLGADIEHIRHAMTMDSRISPEYLKPGCGFGGQNFSQYITDLADVLKEERRSTLLHSVLENNERQKETPFRKLWRYVSGELEGKTISIWGLSFKPNTASIDNAPSLKIIEALLSQGARVQAHDPAANSRIDQKYAEQQNLQLFEDKYQALNNSDALMILTEWREYSTPDFLTMSEHMNAQIIIDGRNLLDKTQAVRAGFYYEGIGR